MAKLYHYTSGSSLHGIIGNSELWATDLRFLNDYQELDHGLTLFEKHYKEISKGLLEKLSNAHDFCYLMEQIVLNIRHNARSLPIHVISFSTKKDNLRQWMAYCQTEVGYCIEFESEELFDDEIKNCDNIQLRNVKYEDECSFDKQDKFPNTSFKLQDDLQRLMFKNKISSENNDEVNKFANHMHKFIIQSMFSVSSVKSLEFNDESEVRVIHIGSKPEGISDPVLDKLSSIYKPLNLQNPKYRLVSDIIVPYQIIPFNLKSIKSVIIGPTKNSFLAEFGLKMFRDINKLTFEIKHSKCTLRRF